MNYNDSFVDSDTNDENEKLNLGKVEDKNDARVKKKVNKNETVPIINTQKLSYRDVLIKGRVNENKDKEDEHEKAVVDLSYQDLVKDMENLKYHEREKLAWDLLDKGFKIISLLPESPVSEYDFENENYDDLPDAPRGSKLTEIELDKLMLKTVGEFYKDTEAGKYFSKAFEIMEGRF
ncbi:hypothetical protein C1645_835149 [Glomus cerebriforme]|uniref:Uncharacterized protein n=1 Tax=Glomus cerebriforme TaxID=658196 RepID=A0A397SCL6_9GLOM|nr:hypothetical protein C1645_835149 [Glomus cerebriforme]